MNIIGISAFLLKLIGQLQVWLGLIAVIFLLHAAFLLWSAQDNPNQKAKGWRQLAAVVAGLVVVLFAKTIVQTIYSWAGVTTPL